MVFSINMTQKPYTFLPRTTITIVVNDRIRRRKRSYTVVHSTKHDRIRSYFVVLLDTRITTVYRRVVYDEIRRIYDHRTRSYPVVYNVVCHRILTSLPYLPLYPNNTKANIQGAQSGRGSQFSFSRAAPMIYQKTWFFLYIIEAAREKRELGHPTRLGTPFLQINTYSPIDRW